VDGEDLMTEATVGTVVREIPHPGTSDARAGAWIGFVASCECPVADNFGEDLSPYAAVVGDDGQVVDTGYVISPRCQLHAGWKPGDTAEIVERPGAASWWVDPAGAEPTP
jgi:hypothetical protein